MVRVGVRVAVRVTVRVVVRVGLCVFVGCGVRVALRVLVGRGVRRLGALLALCLTLTPPGPAAKPIVPSKANANPTIASVPIIAIRNFVLNLMSAGFIYLPIPLYARITNRYTTN
jgi:hypothetical protein